VGDVGVVVLYAMWRFICCCSRRGLVAWIGLMVVVQKSSARCSTASVRFSRRLMYVLGAGWPAAMALREKSGRAASEPAAPSSHDTGKRLG